MIRTFSIAVLLLAAANAHAQLRPFNATYTANYMGMDATATMSLAQSGSQWRYSTVVAAKLGQARQVTTFDEAGGTWCPLSGQDSTAILFKSESRTAAYDWSRRQATWSGAKVKADRRGPIALQPGDVDAMLMNLAIVRDVQAGRPLRYRLVDNSKAEVVNFAIGGREAMTVAGRQVQATRVSGDGLTLWVADGFPVPVRIRKAADNIDLRLQSVR